MKKAINNIGMGIISFLCISNMVNAQTTPSLKISTATRNQYSSNFGYTILTNKGQTIFSLNESEETEDSVITNLLDTISKKLANIAKPLSWSHFNYQRKLKERDEIIFKSIDQCIFQTKFERNKIIQDSAKYLSLANSLSNVKNMKSQFVERKKLDRKEFYQLRHELRNEKTFIITPVWDNFSAQKYFSNGIDTQKFLSNSGITLNGKLANAGVYTEVYHDYLGPFRIGFSAAISNNSSDSANNDIDSLSVQNGMLNRLYSSGGNAVINATFPFFVLQSPLGFYSFRSHLNSKMGFDIQSSTQTNSPLNFMNENSIDGLISLIGIENKISLFIYGKASIIKGFKNYSEQIGFEPNKITSYNQLILGMELGNYLRVSYSFYGGNKVIKDNFSNGLNLTFMNKI